MRCIGCPPLRRRPCSDAKAAGAPGRRAALSYREGLRCAALLLAAWLSGDASADEVLVLHYNERPPYSISQGNGEVIGLVAAPVANALRAAGIRFRWENTPLARQLKILEQGTGYQCMVGLIRTADRDRTSKLTVPVYRDKSMVGIARAGLGLPDSMRIVDLMDDRSKRVMLKLGLTYGATVARLLKEHAPVTELVSAESFEMVRMLNANRADWMPATEEEAGYLIAQAGLGPRDLTIVHFSDVGEGETRHLLCSRAVPDALVQRINAALPVVAENGRRGG